MSGAKVKSLCGTRGGVLLEYALFMVPLIALSLAAVDAYEVLHSYRVLGDALQLAGRELATLEARGATKRPDDRQAFYRWKIYPVLNDVTPLGNRVLGHYLGAPAVDVTLRPESAVPGECVSPGTGFVCSREFVRIDGPPLPERVTYDMTAVFRDRVSDELRAALPSANLTPECKNARCISSSIQPLIHGGRDSLALSLRFKLPLRILGNRSIEVTRERIETLEKSHIERDAQYRIFNCSFTGRSDYSDCHEEQ